MQILCPTKILFHVATIIMLSMMLVPRGAFAMGGKSSDAPVQIPAVNAPAAKPKIKKVFIYIKTPTFKGRETPLRADILKIAIDEVMKSDKYELIFTRNETWRDAKVDFVELIMEAQSSNWGKNIQGYNLQFYLVNGKTGKIMVTAKEDRVEDRRLIFKARSMVYYLFYGKELKDPRDKAEPTPPTPEEAPKDEQAKPPVEKNKEQANKEKPPKEAAVAPEQDKKSLRPPKAPAKGEAPKTDYNFKPPEAPKKPPSEDNQDERNKEKNKDGADGAQGAKGKGGEEDTPPVVANAEDQKPEPIPPVENEAKTPEELSDEIEEEIAKIVKQAKKAAEEKKEEASKDDKKDDAKDVAGEPADAEALTAQAQKAFGASDGNNEKAKKTYFLRMFGVVQTTESSDLVETTNNIKHIGVGILSKLQINPKSNDTLNLELSMTTVVDSDQQFDIPGIKRLSIIYEKTFGSFFFHPHFGLEYETQSFINLAEVGGGLKVWENKLLWYKFGGGFFFRPFNHHLYMVGELGKTFVGTTNYGTDNKARTLDGNKTHFYLGIGTPWGVFFEAHMQVAEMTSQGFTNLSNKETTGYASMLYQF